MEQYLISLLFVVFVYLIGSIPSGSIIARFVAGLDITGVGSGNIGATNVSRHLGYKWGIVTLLLDAAKGYLPTHLAQAALGPELSLEIALLALAPVVGHQFSVFMQFKGGKGVATAAGVWLALSPLCLLIALIPFALAIILWRMVSLGSLCLVSALPFLIWLSGRPQALFASSIATALLVVYRHRDNIRRIMKGSEPRLELKG